jgi:hypothetical protein
MTQPAAVAEALPVQQPDQVIGTPVTVDDRAEPLPRQPSAPEARQLEADDIAAVPQPRYTGEDARAEFYARQRAARERTQTPAEEGEDLMVRATAPFARGEGDSPNENDPFVPETPAAPAAPQAPAAKSYKLKVYGNEFEVDRAQLVALAEVDESIASMMPDIALVALAQKQSAANQRLAAAKQVSPSVDQGGPAGKPPAQGADPNADGMTNATQGGHLADLSDEDLVEKIQFGEKEEARLAIRELNRRDAQVYSREEQAAQVAQTFAQDLNDFVARNTDLVQNRAASVLTINSAMEEAKDLLIASGRYDPQKVSPLTDSQQVLALYKEAYLTGAVTERIAPMMERAAERARTVYAIGKPSTPPQQGQPQQPMSASDERTMAKRGLAQPPSRAGTIERPAQSPTRENARLDALNKMRAARGQQPLPG